MWNEDRGYYYGVILGDGFYEAAPKCSSPYVMLKAADRDFVEYWAACVSRLCGKQYSVYMNSASKNDGKHRALWHCKVYNKELLAETIMVTADKTIIPNGIKSGKKEVKMQFLQGLMDSEGFVTMTLTPLKGSNLRLEFGVSEPWCKEVRELFGEVGILTTPVTRRKFAPTKWCPNQRREYFQFRIDILDYVNAGMTFNIERKRHRLEYITHILRDFTRNYPRYQDYYKRSAVEDKVRPLTKVGG